MKKSLGVLAAAVVTISVGYFASPYWSVHQMRSAAVARLGVPPESVELVHGAHGKPALARDCAAPDRRFNVSHSEDVAVYAFSPGREIGIDVESFV